MRPVFTFCVLLLVACFGGGCLLMGGSTARHRWHTDKWRATPYIFSDWTGVTEEVPVYDFDGAATAAVRLKVQGGPPPPPPPSGQRDIDSFVLTCAAGGVILIEQVPAGKQVRVDGFRRQGAESVKVLNRAKGHWDVGRRHQEFRGADNNISFPVIKTRRVYEVLPDGRERLIWKTDRRFRGL